MTPRLFRRGLTPAIVLLTILSAIPALAADALRSAWDSLPAETVLTFRIPAGNDLLAALRKQTKFGAVALSQERLDKLAAVIKDESQGDWTKMNDDLAKYNLKVEDWHDLFAGEAGSALVLLPRTGQQPLAVGLTWFEPSGDLAQRIFKAVQTSFDDHKGQNGWPDERVDSTIEGQQVTRLSEYIMGLPAPANAVAPGDMSDVPGQKPPGIPGTPGNDDAAKNDQNAKPVQVDETHVLITCIGNRIVIANTFPQSKDAVRNAQATPGAKVDFAAVTGLEPATGLFARFLAAQTGKSDSAASGSAAPGGPSVTATIMATPGLAAALPAGQTAFELLADPRPLIQLANDANPAAPQLIKAFGLDTLGPMAFRLTLDGNFIRSGAFLSVPAPRAGIMTLLDQEPLTAEPPAWAPSSAISFSEISFDLGKAYSRIKELVIGANPQAAAGFQMAEASVQMQLQADVPTLLSSLGHEHQIMQLLPVIPPPAQPAADGAPPAPGAPGSAGGTGAARHEAAKPMQRVAIVWQVTDPGLWKKVFEALTPNLGAMMGPLVQEQGFTGWRTKQSGIETAFFLGEKYLLLAFGPEVSESTMAWLRTPPEGKDSLRAGPLYDRAKAIFSFEPCQMFGISDGNRSARAARDMIAFVIDQIATTARDRAARQIPAPGAGAASGGGDDANDAPPGGVHDPKALAAKIKALLPTDDELEGMFGVGVNQAVVKAPGVTLQSVAEMPPPGK